MTAGGASRSEAVDVVRDYHRLTSYEPPKRFGDRSDPRMVRGYQAMDLRLWPPPFKRYPDAPANEPVPGDLDEALFLSAGVVRFREAGALGRVWFRAAGSAGNLAPLEVYVLRDGRVLHYGPLEHRLTEIGRCGDGPTSIVVTGVPWRTAWKYTERGYRHLYWDCGTMLAHLLALLPDGRLHVGFVDDDLAAVVGADGEHEFPLAVVVLGPGDPPGPAGTDAGAAKAGVLADQAVGFPFIPLVQRATALAGPDAVAAWRVASPQPPDRVDLALGSGLALRDVIARRGSTRAFDPEATGPSELLHAAMAAATAPLNADFVAAGGSLLEHHVLVHAIEGEPAVPGSRDAGRHLCLDQGLGGDGCYTAFHCADLDAVLSGLGPRGYRAALVEAGIVEGRLHLCAFALGFGATGLTFFDEEVRTWFSTASSPMLVTAVGRPAYRYRAPIGTPGNPAELTRWG